MQCECVILKELRSMLSSNTVHLLFQRSLSHWLSRNCCTGRHCANKGVYKVQIHLGASASLCALLLFELLCVLLPEMGLENWEPSCSVQQLHWWNPLPHFSTLCFLSPAITLPLLFLSNSSAPPPPASTTTPPATSNNCLSLLKHRSSFLCQRCLPLSALVWNWIADPLALSGRDVIWDSGNRMLWCWRQLLQDTKGSQMTLDSSSSSLPDWKCSQQISWQHKGEHPWTTNRNTQGFRRALWRVVRLPPLV